jgi:hypothetical protein
MPVKLSPPRVGVGNLEILWTEFIHKKKAKLMFSYIIHWLNINTEREDIHIMKITK